MRLHLRKVILLAAFALFALPAAAWAGAGDHCDHDAAPHGAAHTAHHHEDTAVEEVPLGGADQQKTSPLLPRHACKENMTLKCNMMAGCCIKSDGPLSTGLSDRPATDNDLVLSGHPVQPIAGRMANISYRPWNIPQNRAKPDPRPPSA